MQTKVLIIAVIRRSDTILMRKKPDGSAPYTETWYIFGAELLPGGDPHQLVQELVQKQAGIQVRMTEQSSWDTEVKDDLDGVRKQFVYLDALFEYVEGELKAGEGIERLEWVPIEHLSEYDIVPPSRVLFKKLGYL